MVTLALIAVLSMQDDDALTPSGLVGRLNEIRALMEKSAEDLNALMPSNSREKQVATIRAIEELLRKGRDEAGRAARGGTRTESRRVGLPRVGCGGTDKTERRAEPGEIFRGVSGHRGWSTALPATMREALLHGLEHIDEYPEEVRATLRTWSKKLASGGQE